MHYSQYFWGIFYLLNLLLVSLAAGTLTLVQPRLLKIPRLSRFLVGFCSTPFLLACWMLLISALPISVPRLFFVLFPPSISALVIIRFRKKYLTLLQEGKAAVVYNYTNSNLIKAIYIGLIIVSFVMFIKTFINSLSPIIAYDALRYLSEALKFCKTLSINSINGFRDWPDGTLRGNMHNFIWPGYLSYALITTNLSNLGYPFDYAAHLAFQVTVLYMLLSLIAFSGLIERKGVAPLSVLILLLVPDFQYISSSFSRDAFRIIPLLLLSTVLIGSIHQVKIYKKFGRYLFLPFIVGYFVIGGHILNILPLFSIVISWLICSLKVGRNTCRHNFRYLTIILAVAIGTLIGGSQIVLAYIETGSIVGESFYDDQAIAGTPLEKAYHEVQEERLQGAKSALERINIIASRDYYFLSIAGFITALIILFKYKSHISKNKKNPLLITSIIVIINSFTISDLFSWGGFSLTKWYVMNFRYQLHFYPFASICIAAFIIHLYNNYVKRPSPNRNIHLKKQMLAILIAVIILCSIKTVIIDWRQNRLSTMKNYIHQTTDPIRIAIKEYPIKNILLDDLRYNYYLDSSAILMYTKPTWPIFRATNAEQLNDIFQSLDINIVVLSRSGIKQYWDKIYLYKYLEDPIYSEILCDNDNNRIYRILFRN